jgi:Sulfatase
VDYGALAGTCPVGFLGCFPSPLNRLSKRSRIAGARGLDGAIFPFRSSARMTAEGNVNTSPNIVFILVDNVGWGSFGVYGGTIPTPRIDRLANEGIRFNNYNVEAQCTPTRSAIMTGRHPVRSGTFKVPFPGQGLSGMGAVGIHARRTPLRRRLCHRLVRQMAPGRPSGAASDRSRLRRTVGGREQPG